MKYNYTLKEIKTIPIDIFKTILYISSCLIFTLLFIKIYHKLFLIKNKDIDKLKFYNLLGHIVLDLIVFSIFFILVNKLVKLIWLIIGFNISLETLHKEYFGAVSLILVFIILHFFDSFQYKMTALHKKLNEPT